MLFLKVRNLFILLQVVWLLPPSQNLKLTFPSIFESLPFSLTTFVLGACSFVVKN